MLFKPYFIKGIGDYTVNNNKDFVILVTENSSYDHTDTKF